MVALRFIMIFVAGVVLTASAVDAFAQEQAAQPVPPQQGPVTIVVQPVASPAEAAPPHPGYNPAPAGALTLEDCLNVALGGHPRIKAAVEDLVGGKLKVIETEAAWWPTLAFQANRQYVHSERPVSAGPVSTTTSSDNWANNINFNAAWTFYNFGRTGYAVAGTRALEAALTMDLNATEQTVAYDVMDAYFNLLKAQTLVGVAEQTLAAAKGHLKQAQAFYDVGVKPRFDVTKAEVEVNDASLQVLQAKDAVRAARMTLNTKMGIQPQSTTIVSDRPNLEKLEKPVDEYIREALANRPELRGLQARLQSGELTVRAENANYYPQLSASMSQNLYNDDTDNFYPNTTVQFSLDLPVFEGFRTRSRVGEARAAVNAAKYRIEDAKTNVMNDVSQAYLSVEDARARLDTLTFSVRQAKENLDIAQGRYEAGVGALIDVTDAQVALTKAMTDEAQAFYDYHLAYSRLLRSTGSGPVKTAGK